MTTQNRYDSLHDLSNRQIALIDHMANVKKWDAFNIHECAWCESDKEFTLFQTAGPSSYRVLTESERTEIAVEYIKDTLWAFLPSWIAWWMERNGQLKDGEDVDTMTEIIKATGDMFEAGNAIRARLIGDVEKFALDAIEEDGHAHWISSYDDLEHEFTAPDGTKLFIYRTN